MAEEIRWSSASVPPKGWETTQSQSMHSHSWTEHRQVHLINLGISMAAVADTPGCAYTYAPYSFLALLWINFSAAKMMLEINSTEAS